MLKRITVADIDELVEEKSNIISAIQAEIEPSEEAIRRESVRLDSLQKQAETLHYEVLCWNTARNNMKQNHVDYQKAMDKLTGIKEVYDSAIRDGRVK